MTSAKSTARSNPRLRADLLLLLVAIIWGSSFVVQRLAAQQANIYLFNGMRFLLGALVMAPFLLFGAPARRQFHPGVLPWMALAGFLLFAGSSLQQYGLRFTTAANAGFITGLYVVLIPLYLALVLRRPPSRVVWLAASMATLGLYLLSTNGSFTLAHGDIYELAGAAMWASHVLLIGWLVQRTDVYPLAVIQYLACAILSLGLGWWLEPYQLRELSGIWWTVLYTGVFSISLGFTLQAVGQKVAPPADAAIILSCEAAFAALSGWILLDERLNAIQLAGCGLMLSGMILAQMFSANGRDKQNLIQGEATK
jgi:drug/metabolite transporter (DMT)-like permease